MQQVRTSVSGRVANSTTLPNPGQIAINITDGRMFSTNGTNYFEIGGNVATINVSSAVSIGNSTVNTVINSTSIFSAGAPELLIVANVVVSGVVNTTANAMLFGNTTDVALDISYWNGNSSVNTYSNSYLNASSLTIGNSVANSLVTPTSIVASNGYVRSQFVQTASHTGTSYTTVNSDSGTVVQFTNASSVTVTVANTMAPNSRFIVTQLGAGIVTIANQAGQALKSRSGTYVIGNQYGSASVFVVNSSLVLVDGCLTNTGGGGGGGGTPGGSDTQLQFNQGGSAFGGDANLAWNYTSEILIIGGSAATNAAISASNITLASAATNSMLNAVALWVGNSTVNSIYHRTGITLNSPLANATINATCSTMWGAQYAISAGFALP